MHGSSEIVTNVPKVGVPDPSIKLADSMCSCESAISVSCSFVLGGVSIVTDCCPSGDLSLTCVPCK